MAKTGQLYRVPLSDTARKKSKPAQFVFLGSESDEVVGFITEVDQETQEMEICLFNPSSHIFEDALILEAEMSKDDTYILLERALKANPEMRGEWQILVDEALSVDPMVGGGYPSNTIIH